jgi:hypothetical protein
MQKIRQGAGAAVVISCRGMSPQEVSMSKKDRKNNTGARDGELSEQQLDRIAGGQEVRKMETIVVTAKRPQPEAKVVKMETIVVTAQRDKPDLAGTKLAEADPKSRKN